jgi:hypothetical protein
MKNKKMIIAATVLVLLMSTGIVMAATQTSNEQGNQNESQRGTSAECITDDTALSEDGTEDTGGTQALQEEATPELEAMLIAAIEDEYKAQAEYDALIDEFGAVKPITNIIKAEASHINALEVLFASYGLPVPEDNGAEFAVIPSTLEAAFQAGVDAEIKNIAIYEEFLKQDLPQDVEDTFTNLMNASENHLAAFERQLD